jgi:hypothetical protein
MNMHRIGRKWSAAVAFLALVASATASPAAGGDQWFDGVWFGQVRASSGDKPVTLNLRSPGRAGAKSQLVYGEPRGCTLDAEYVGPGSGKDSQLYTLVLPTGGFCDNLLNGKLYLEKQGEKVSLVVTYQVKQSAVSESGVLSRRARRPSPGGVK